MKDFSFKALIVFIIVLISGLILVPLLAPKTIIENEYNAFVFLAEGEFNYVEQEGYVSDNIYENTDNFFDLLFLEFYVNNDFYFTNFISHGLNVFKLHDYVISVSYICENNVTQLYVDSVYLGPVSYRVWGVNL